VAGSQKAAILSTISTDEKMYDPDKWYDKWLDSEWIDHDPSQWRMAFLEPCPFIPQLL
jgi:hypothetical protein